ncbi:MAG: chemotaxis protein CheW [Pseudomonadota bacterium]
MKELASAARVLHERAVALARAPRADSAPDALLELLEFKLANERYAVETRHVVEVHPLRDLTPLPGTPPFIRGIVNLRGRILPVLDLKKFFDLPEQGVTDLHRIIVVRGEDLEFGLLADVVVSVHTVAGNSLAPALPTLSEIGAEYLKGVSEERLVVLDLERIFADPKIIVHDEADS